MKNEREKNNIGQSKRLFGYVITVFIIYVTDCILFEIGANNNIIYGSKIVLILVAIIAMSNYLIKSPRIDINILLVTLSVTITMLVYGGYTGFGYYPFIAALWFGYCYSKKYSLEDFSETFCNVMRIIAIASIIVLIFAPILYKEDFFPLVISNRGESYRFLYLSTIPLKVHMQYRNWGPFWEPGVYQIYLNVALFLTLFVRKDKKRKMFDSVLFVLTGFTTFSGAFIVPMLLIISAYALNERKTRAFKIFFVICLISIAIVYSGLFDSALNKMLSFSSESNLIYRFIALKGGLLGFIRNPIIGSSDAVNKAIKASLALQYTGSGYASNANTFANLLGYLGAYVGGFVIIKTIKMFKSVVFNRFALILVCIAYFITTSNENLMASTLVLTLCFLRSNPNYNMEDQC